MPGAPATTVSLAGLKLHAALAGSVPHANVNVPEEPLMVVNTSVKLAACPLDTVWLDEPESAAAKSKPIPERPACSDAATALLVSVSFQSVVPQLPD
ncbi:MAG TPA: hypothetical protein VMR02_08635 [Terracidiphilus sp.]|nr:hypothetical protein [Terracidiphilus sp.]